MADSYEQITSEQRDRVLLLTLNRPEKLNAWTPRMMRELTDAITAANDDPSIGAMVVTGAGRGFCAGADMESVLAGGDAGLGEVESSAGDWVGLCRSSKPLLAALNGAAIGVGITMVLPFDQIFAAKEAKISVRFVKLGIVPSSRRRTSWSHGAGTAPRPGSPSAGTRSSARRRPDWASSIACASRAISSTRRWRPRRCWPGTRRSRSG